MKILLLALLFVSPVYAGNFNDNGINMNTGTDANLFRVNVASHVGAYVYSIDRTSTTLCTQNVWTVVAGTEAPACLGWFTDNDGSSVTYIGATPIYFCIEGYVNGRVTNVNDIINCAIFINGAIQETSHTKRLFVSTANDYGNMHALVPALLSNGDVVSLCIMNESGNGDFITWKWNLRINTTL